LSTSFTAAQSGHRPRGQLEPGLTMTDRNERVREIAYFLWLDEGQPEGGAERHWAAAEALLESEPEERKRIDGEPPGEPVSPANRAPQAPEVRGARRAS
jgi:hypothetical protein